ncbi:MAG: 2-oxoglutarate dehydrogenase complex dihydrolipoyllysine-residue succinyltransferase [Phycisphaerales bacterium]|nr:2-oxoglutarate dehydrogenase complex dihydrolipoyllysine-residue succinyltransferase [Planctomycetota bacterium]MCH8507895.1 2-oxoglutarate dehydrogenase complex dihydrolipoyllysine-residue succinyltransferase [Phycisphaerales bacterium]
MGTKIVIPNIGESVTSGVIASWSVKDGEYVERDQTVLELETDKVTMEVPAPAAGVVKHGASEGDEVEVGAVVGEIDESAAKSDSSGSSKESEKSEKSDGGDDKSDGGGTATAAPPEEKPEAKKSKEESKPKPDSGSGDKPPATAGSHKATPLARKLADDNGIDLGSVSATGAGGRIREQDVLAYIQTRSNGAASKPAGEQKSASGSRSVRQEKMTPLRQRIASRLVEAQQTAAMLTTFNEVDMGAVMDLRKQHKEAFEKKHGIGLGFMSFFVKAATQGLQKFPLINAYIVAGDDGKPAIERHEYQDIAIAVAGPKGLVVPVIRNTEDMSFAEIESAIKDFGARAKDGKLELSEMTGGTFTITNGGVFGSLMSTPILNPPQSAILGMHTIKSRPVEYPEKSGQVALRPMMYLALSYDHRIVDGAEAVQFLVSIKNAIEDPARLMLDL